MGDGNTTLLTVVIVVIAIIVVLWLLWNLNKDSVRVGPRPEPVGGVKSENIGPGGQDFLAPCLERGQIPRFHQQ